MRALSERDVRRSMVNCSRGEATGLTLPKTFADLDWEGLDLLGWRDPRAPLRGYVITWRDDTPVGVALRAAESTMSARRAAMCLLCRTVHSADNVSLFTARRAGSAGRAGNTIGTYICADLGCCEHVRVGGPASVRHPDPEVAYAERRAALRERLDTFVTHVLETAD
ncbi:FBP domain-containing protein [Longispora sp. K20-0274]|uniref:FBP domain-containing protein n=1 Tax=Longispora sp. K20-0274 TaxID=3088255 RepID=UPI00399BADEF